MKELGLLLHAHEWFIEPGTTFSSLVDAWTIRWGILYLAVGILYLPTIFTLQYLWRNQTARNLKKVRIVHNLIFCVFSTVAAIETTPTMINTWITSDSFLETVCGGYYLARPESFWLYAFGCSKLFELIESLYFILEQKPIPFIHWYHHILTFIVSTHAMYLKESSIIYYVWMNLVVHAVMYFYYTYASATNTRPSWAPIVTVMQILQMFVGTTVTAAVFWCDKWDIINSPLGLFMYLSYVYLFCDFFLKRFIFKKAKKDKKQ